MGAWSNSCGSIILCSLLVLLQNASAQQASPALFWSPEKSMSHLPEVNSADPVSADLLQQEYLGPLMQHSAESAVVFLRNKLHVDDFTRFADVYNLDSDGGAFKNIRSFMDELFSLELPQVEDPLKAVEKLKSSFTGAVHTAASLADVEKLNLSPDHKFLLIIELPTPADVRDEEQAISSNDASVGAICHHLQKRGIKYTAMFTGKSSSESQPSGVETYSGRHLLAEEAHGNGTFMNVSGMALFLRSAQVHVQNGDKSEDYNFTITDNIAGASTKDNKTAMIQFDLAGNGTETPVKIVFNATNQGDRWTISQINLTVGAKSGGKADNGNLTDSPLRADDLDLVVPILYSFHCSSMKLYVDTVRNTGLVGYKGTYVILGGLQIQPFNVQRGSFFNAQDCVGFFSRGIWMGIFTSLILLAILIFGVMMVLNLSTPDRFDDPKGKTIVIAQAED